jgi:hypothetical protein
MLDFWGNWHIKKCCDKLEEYLDSGFDSYWILDGELTVIMFEGDPELETIFELEECQMCGSKIVCYQTVGKN